MEKGNDGERFTVLIQAMAATFRADVTPALLEGYWMGLEDLPIEKIERAVRRGIRECEFMPAAFKLRELVAGGGPDYYQPAAAQLEQIETCAFHSARECIGKAPEFVPWCRKCRRLARLASWPTKRLELVPPEDEAS